MAVENLMHGVEGEIKTPEGLEHLFICSNSALSKDNYYLRGIRKSDFSPKAQEQCCMKKSRNTGTPRTSNTFPGVEELCY